MNTCNLRSTIQAAKLKIRFQKRQIKRALKYSKVTIYIVCIKKKQLRRKREMVFTKEGWIIVFATSSIVVGGGQYRVV